ncbi:RNA-guided endonuclease InsQ/TnpB family protein [Sphingomonas pituitosa]|uniref:RNA-guided endonuclease InsQ/TnpB family protein n=1 Tax=Sphingomonas pituitosa TaxID=99597 RepID=UPI0008312BDF|nr:RNA-guided endonuclease TnpB family protein [Sphingomonas pituitosa]
MPQQILTHVYRLQPTRAQHAALAKILKDQRFLYNAALQERRDAWRRAKVSIGLNDQTRALTEIRGFDPTYSGVPYDVSKWTLKRLDDAMRAFFKRVKAKAGKAGFPRFRSEARWRSFGFHQKDGLRVRNGRLLFSGGIVGGLRMRMHRPLPDDAVLKSAVFTREGNVWRVALTIKTETAPGHSRASTAIGVDVGVNWLAATSDGVFFENHRPRRQREKALRRAARALARCQQGSRRRRKVRARLQREQRHVRNIRTTCMHDVANAIARSASTIFVEALNLKNMTRSASGSLAEPGVQVMQKRGLNRSLADAAPGRLIAMLRYKAERAGVEVVAIDPRNTSRTCSACGVVDAAQLGRDRYRCGCGLDLQRDHNAAINILQRGFAVHEAARRLGDRNVAGRGERGPVNADPLAA